MRIYIGCDHAAWESKEILEHWLIELGHEVYDCGTKTGESVHYPTYAQAVCKEVLGHDESRGILLCGSGIGMSMAANRYQGIRAALCRSDEDAKICRQHNNANVICFGARVSSEDQMKKMTDIWLQEKFEGGRHQTRIDLIESL